MAPPATVVKRNWGVTGVDGLMGAVGGLPVIELATGEGLDYVGRGGWSGR
jgi:hypothetical protein